MSVWLLRPSRTTALGNRLVGALEAIASVKSARRVPVPGAGQMGYSERLPLTVRAVIEAPTREEAHRCLHAAAAQVGATLPAGTTVEVWVGAPLIDERDGGPNRGVGERWGVLA